MSETLEQSGYVVRFRVREMKKRKRVNGRARGFYEGNYVYLRVRGPDGVTRDLYLGTATESARPRTSRVGRKSGSSSSSPAAAAKGRKRGEKATEPDIYEDLYQAESRFRRELAKR